MKNLFTEHLNSVGETYTQHMIIAINYGVRLRVAGLACLMHAFLPFLCQKTGSDVAKAISDDIAARHQKKD